MLHRFLAKAQKINHMAQRRMAIGRIQAAEAPLDHMAIHTAVLM